MPQTVKSYYKLHGPFNEAGIRRQVGIVGLTHQDSTHSSLAEALSRKNEVAPFLESWIVFREEIIRTPVASSEEENEY